MMYTAEFAHKSVRVPRLDGTTLQYLQGDGPAAAMLGTTHTPEFGITTGLHSGDRPVSCPGGTISVSAGPVQLQLVNTGGGLFEVCGMETRCDDAAKVDKIVRHSSSGQQTCISLGVKRSTSSSSGGNFSFPANDRITAWLTPEQGRQSSCGGLMAEDIADSKTNGTVTETDRAMQLALSLRERVLQLEQQNRALEQRLQSLQGQHTQQSGQDSKCLINVLHTDVQSAHSNPARQLRVCLFPTMELNAQAVAGARISSSTGDSSDNDDAQLLAPTTPPAADRDMASELASSAATAMDTNATGDYGTPQHLRQSEQHQGLDSNCCRQQRQQAVAGGLKVFTNHAFDLSPPGTPLPRTPGNSDSISNGGGSCHPPSDAAAAKLAQERQQQLAELLQREQQYQQTIASLQHQLDHTQMLHGLLQTDYADLECVLKETEKQRREYAARYAFVVIDSDADGYISVEQVAGYELFACYARPILHAAFAAWQWRSGFPGYLNIDDFVRFVEYAEDRSTTEAQSFWFGVLDADGDGRLSWQDMKEAYDAVDKSSARFVIPFEDLMNQIRDMVQLQQHSQTGFTRAELRASKLGAGVIGLLTNHNNMLLQRSTAEWGRGEYPL